MSRVVTRFEQYFPYASRLIGNPFLSGLVVFPIAIAVSVASVHYGLAMVLGWLTLLAYYLERRILEFWLFPPFASLFLWQFLGQGVGVSLIISEAPTNFDPELFTMQVIWILGFPAFYLSYAFFFKRIQDVVVPIAANPEQLRSWRPLHIIAWIFLTLRIGGFIHGAYTGAEDRGEFGLGNSSDATFGIWTMFQLVPRFNNMGFLLLPILWVRAETPQRLILACMLGSYFLFAFVSGGRGHIIFPIIFVFTGYYAFFQLKRRPWDLFALIVAVGFMPMIFIIGSYRGTDGFVGSRMIDVTGRLSALGETGEMMRTQNNSAETGGRTVTGKALLGVNDHLVYAQTPSLVPHAGFEGFSAVPLVWVPTFFMREKPILIDGNFIVAQYVDYEIARTTGSTISLPADLFRRFGWLGVCVGMPLAFFAFGAVSYSCYAIFLRKNFVIGTVAVLFMLSFISWSPFQTLLTTWWIFAYDIPRHLIVLVMLYLIAINISGVNGSRGALQYWPTLRK